jgi:hypothetical protein
MPRRAGKLLRYERVDGFLAEYFGLWVGRAIGIGAEHDLTN